MVPRIRTCHLVPCLGEAFGMVRNKRSTYYAKEGVNPSGLDGDNPKNYKVKNPAASSNTLIGTYKVPVASRDPKLFSLESKIVY